MCASCVYFHKFLKFRFKIYLQYKVVSRGWYLSEPIDRARLSERLDKSKKYHVEESKISKNLDGIILGS